MSELEDDLLDDQDASLFNDKFMNFVAWWERRRLYYNIILLLTCAIAVANNWSNAKNAGWISLCLTISYYGLIANVFYTMGWASELLRNYYGKTRGQVFYRIKWGIWLLLSICSTIYLYQLIEVYLENWSPFIFFEF